MTSFSAGANKIAGVAIAATFVTTAVMLSGQTPVQAQAAYGSYIGVGASLGLSSDDNDDGSGIAAVITTRYKFLEAPLSVRTQAFIGESTAVVPTISYDFPLSWQTDAYIGAGVSFANGEEPSPVGDQTSFVIQPGVDYVIPNGNTVIYGNAVVAFDAFENGGGTAVAIQGGLGLRF
ncbi:hypothetical protein Lepto7376_3057 [[Leptolyngbya] sp. PCC 7376]|uniref:hypothetical protein n=1 Tax=[Leptolyngbya] sp. PCC 7376 TaxID=111781 RepID=UPI00029EC44B|nr:hypothetical protein [[Leptolyngbya] sp. PCC 7376]AFY39297.1 hypothetical protein Lepto7376_3057 [[Leptolyngbya] sp. PCC 7376]